MVFVQPSKEVEPTKSPFVDPAFFDRDKPFEVGGLEDIST